MDFNSVEGLNETDIEQLYEDIIESSENDFLSDYMYVQIYNCDGTGGTAHYPHYNPYTRNCTHAYHRVGNKHRQYCAGDSNGINWGYSLQKHCAYSCTWGATSCR